jgi:hypothetical protein
LFVFEFAGHFPHGEALAGFHEFGSVIEDEKAFDAKAFDDDLAEAGEGRIVFGVAGNEPAKNDAAVDIHAVHDGLHDVAADVFEIDVDAIGRGSGQFFFPIGLFVVDGGVEAEVVLNPFTFFVGPGDADDAAAVDLAKRPRNAAGGASRGGDNQRFTLVGPADLQQAEVGGESSNTEGAKEIRVRKKGNRGKFLERARFFARDDDVFLEAGEAEELVALFVVGMARFDDFGKAEGAHDFADLDGRHVLREVDHPYAHGGIEGEIFYFGEGLVFANGGNGRFDELEGVWSDEAGGTRVEKPLVVGGHVVRVARRKS